MKTLQIIVLALLASCAAPEPEAKQVLYLADGPISEYLKRDMHDPGSLSFENTSLALRLDTVQDPAMFSGKRDYFLIQKSYRGKNAFGALVLNEAVFYVTQEGDCIYHQPTERLTDQERAWVSAVSLKAFGE